MHISQHHVGREEPGKANASHRRGACPHRQLSHQRFDVSWGTADRPGCPAVTLTPPGLTHFPLKSPAVVEARSDCCRSLLLPASSLAFEVTAAAVRLCLHPSKAAGEKCSQPHRGWVLCQICHCSSPGLEDTKTPKAGSANCRFFKPTNIL